ncbi:MAG: Ig-like domain-containing protein, partial [Coriobacteriales bacterium]|nr:Ig-like domain-containing protein [Coriobacteriales bacterium]
NYTGTKTINFAITAIAQSTAVVVTDPGTKTYGDAPFALGATGGNGSGGYVFELVGSPNAGTLAGDTVTITGAGAINVRAKRSGDGNYSESGWSATQTITVAKANQSALTINSLPAHTFGSPYTITSTGGSGTGAVSYEIVAGGTGIGSLSGTGNNTLAITQAGTFMLKATKAADANYNAQDSSLAPFTLTVSKASQSTLSINSSATHTFGSTYTISSTGGSGTGSVSYSIEGGTGSGTLSGTNNETLTITQAGTFILKATKAGDVNYSLAESATFLLTVAKASQLGTPVVDTPATITYGTSPATLTASGITTGLAWEFRLAEPNAKASISATGTLSFTGAGTVKVQVRRLGDANYLDSAWSAVKDIIIEKADQSPLSVTPPSPALVYGNSGRSLSSSGGSGTGAVSYTLDAGTAASVAAGGALSITGVGAITVTATKAGDANYKPVSSLPLVIAIGPAPITGFVNPSSVIAGKSDNPSSFVPGFVDSPTTAATLLALYPTVTANIAGGSLSVPVSAWVSVGTAYDKTIPGEYRFEATLGALPAEATNAGAHTATVTVIVNDVLHGVTLDQSGSISLGTVPYGYTTASLAHSVGITNIGTQATGSLKATLTGANPASFIVSGGGVLSSIAFGQSSSALTVTPASGLAAGSYSATLTIASNEAANADLVPKSYEVSFTVTPAELTGFEPLADVVAGSAGAATFADAAAVIAALPTSATATFAGGTITVPITSWQDTDGYDPSAAGSYTFSAVLGLLPANVQNSGGHTATVEVVISVVDKDELQARVVALNNQIAAGPTLGLHEKNYDADTWADLLDALAAVPPVLSDPFATQAAVDDALAALNAAVGGLVRNHQVLEHSHQANLGGQNGLTALGQEVTIEFRGDYRDITAFALNGTAYTLSAYVDEVTPRIITERGGATVGSITNGSGIVQLLPAFTDRLQNGTHILTVTFVDASGSQDGTATLVVMRSTGSGGSGGNGADPGAGTPIPSTGDDSLLGSVAGVLAVSGLLMLALVWFVRRRRGDPASAERR